jgi:hypothetical protein
MKEKSTKSWEWVAYGYGSNRNAIWGGLDLTQPSGKRFYVHNGCFYNTPQLGIMIKERKNIGFKDTLSIAKNNASVVFLRDEFIDAYKYNAMPQPSAMVEMLNTDSIHSNTAGKDLIVSNQTIKWSSVAEFKQLINKLAEDRQFKLPMSSGQLYLVCTDLAEVIINDKTPNLVRHLSTAIPKHIINIISEFVERSFVAQSDKFEIKCPEYAECDDFDTGVEVENEFCGFYGIKTPNQSKGNNLIYPDHMFYGQEILYDHDEDIEL